jgi:hypothetical protein
VPKRRLPGEATFAQSRFERNTQSGKPFGVPEVMQIAEPESTRDDAHPIATGIVIIGRVKRLLKIADQIKPERERDQPLAMMVARVGKFDVNEVPLGFALIAAAWRAPVVVHNKVSRKNVPHARGLASFSSTR